MTDPNDLFEAISVRLATIPGVQTSPINLSNPTLPCLFVLGHDQIDYGNGGFGRSDTGWNLIVRGYVSTVVDKGSHSILNSWLASSGTNSVKAAIEGDPTLGGLADWVLVEGSRGSAIFSLPNQLQALGTDFAVQVQTSN